MSDDKNKNNEAWVKIFDKYDVVNEVLNKGSFKISAEQIKEFREPRLMAKFDHSVNLPKIFKDHHLAILPITRGDYLIARFENYHQFEFDDGSIDKVSYPPTLQSLTPSTINSETKALNCALAAGIISDFLDEPKLYATVSGRMKSDAFDFLIRDVDSQQLKRVSVNNSQIEIDGAYEGAKSLALFEAKNDLSDDFLVRQLYYPYRTWQDKVTKLVRPIFIVYSNGIFKLYEYKFEDPNSYSSIKLVKQKNYAIEDTKITIEEIFEVLKEVASVDEPQIPFPQADKFERVINLCELLASNDLDKDDITQNYAFDARQTDYYTNAAIYLGLVEKSKSNGNVVYKLSDDGRKIIHLSYKQRQLELCKRIMEHRVFKRLMMYFMDSSKLPDDDMIINAMKEASLYKVSSEETYHRRARTVKKWLSWMVALPSISNYPINQKS